MPKAKIPSYRLHRASGQAVVTLNGRDHYLGPHKSKVSRTEYDRLVGEWLANGRHLEDDDERSDLRICELVDRYLAFAEAYYSDNGTPGREYVAMEAVTRPLVQYYSRERVVDFGPLSLKAIRQRWVEQKLTRNSVNQRVNRIRRIFKWGVENELVPAMTLHALQAVAPLKRGRTEAKESVPVKPVPDAHVDAVQAVVARQVATMIELQRLTGMRPGEVVLLRPCDVDQSGDIWTYILNDHKTAYRGHARTVYLGPKAQAVLRPWLQRGPDSYCFSPAEAEAERNEERKKNRKSPMTPSQAKRRPKKNPKRAKRDRYDVASYRRAITYGIQRAKVPRWHPHQLRHNCGTRLRRDFSLDTAQVILGHRTADVTQVYAEADRNRALEVVRQVG